MPRIRSLLVVGHVLALCGCTIAQLEQESGQMRTRIVYKEANLGELERERVALAAERTKLLSDIDTKQLTLTDLDAGLERLRRANSRLTTETAQQQREKQRVDVAIQKLQAEISRVRDEPSASDRAKMERVEALKQQIKAQLQILITQ
jgi:chromosome segregation ATPase